MRHSLFFYFLFQFLWFLTKYKEFKIFIVSTNTCWHSSCNQTRCCKPLYMGRTWQLNFHMTGLDLFAVQGAEGLDWELIIDKVAFHASEWEQYNPQGITKPICLRIMSSFKNYIFSMQFFLSCTLQFEGNNSWWYIKIGKSWLQEKIKLY